MNQELEAFRHALRQAGQPWSRRGVMTVGVGVVGLLVAQLIAALPSAHAATTFLLAEMASAAVVMVGWVFLIVAFVRRRAWAKAQRVHEPALPADPEAS